MLKNILILSIGVLWLGVSHAAPFSCNTGTVLGVIVMGDVTEGAVQANKLFIELNDAGGVQCTVGNQGVRLVYIEDSSSAYEAVMSIASMAYVTRSDVRFIIDDATGVQGLDASGVPSTDVADTAYRIVGIYAGDSIE